MTQRFPRVQISEIIEINKINNPNLAISVVLEMIKNREINAEFFESCKSLVFDLQMDMDEIDKLLKTYEEWEEEDYKKII